MNFDYSKLRSGDVFFSNASSIIGAAIRVGEKPAWESITDRSMPNHAGQIYDLYGQKVAAEITPNGFRIDSLEIYRKPSNQIVSIWRWDGLDVDKYNQYIATWVRRRQDRGKYDYWGALRASPWIRRVLPWLRDSKRTEFCSENVAETFRTMGAVLPLIWQDCPPNPYELYQWIRGGHHWTAVEGWIIRN